MAITFSTEAKNTMLDALDTLVGSSGFLDFYDVTPTLLAKLPLSAAAFAAALNGVLTANSITADSAADAAGTAVTFKLTKSDGTEVMAGTVGTSGADCNLTNNITTIGQPVTVTSMLVNFNN